MRLSEAEALLRAAGIPDARREARELFSSVGGRRQSELLFPDCECDLPELVAALERRAKREPLQYIIGEVGFYREKYKVSPKCLIPRSDTEILVDYAVKHIPEGSFFTDLCTGSGCVAISTLANTCKTRARAIDVSQDALDVAMENAAANGVSERIELVRADVLFDRPKDESYAVLANPPYVTEEEYRALAPELYCEPKLALVGGDGGLIFYKRITELYKNAISPEGFIAFEIGHTQARALIDIAARANMTCEIIKDLSENDRVAVLRRL